MSVGLAIHDLPVMTNHEHRAWNLVLGDRVVDDGIEDGEARVKGRLTERGGAGQKHD